MNSKITFLGVAIVVLVIIIFVLFNVMVDSEKGMQVSVKPIDSDSLTGRAVADFEEVDFDNGKVEIYESVKNRESNFPDAEKIKVVCEEKHWDCTEWSECLDNQQKRTCTKLSLETGKYCYNGYEPETIVDCFKENKDKPSMIQKVTGMSIKKSSEIIEEVISEEQQSISGIKSEQEDAESSFEKLKKTAGLWLLVVMCFAIIITVIFKERAVHAKLNKNLSSNEEQQETNRIMKKYT